jgi:hypothetical protein
VQGAPDIQVFGLAQLLVELLLNEALKSTGRDPDGPSNANRADASVVHQLPHERLADAEALGRVLDVKDRIVIAGGCVHILIIDQAASKQRWKTLSQGTNTPTK